MTYIEQRILFKCEISAIVDNDQTLNLISSRIFKDYEWTLIKAYIERNYDNKNFIIFSYNHNKLKYFSGKDIINATKIITNNALIETFQKTYGDTYEYQNLYHSYKDSDDTYTDDDYTDDDDDDDDADDDDDDEDTDDIGHDTSYLNNIHNIASVLPYKNSSKEVCEACLAILNDDINTLANLLDTYKHHYEDSIWKLSIYCGLFGYVYKYSNKKMDFIKLLIEKKFSPNCVSNDDCKILDDIACNVCQMDHVLQEDRDLTIYLLNNGFDLKKNNGFNHYLLNAWAFDEEILDILIQKGIDLNIGDYIERNVLCNIFNDKKPESVIFDLVKKLIANGVNVNGNLNNDEDHQMPPLFMAVIYGSLDIIKYMVEKGANIHAKNDYGNVLNYAVRRNSDSKGNEIEILNYFMSLGVKECKSEHTLIELAALQCDIELIECLIANGCNILQSKKALYNTMRRNFINFEHNKMKTSNDVLSCMKYLFSKGLKEDPDDPNNTLIRELCQVNPDYKIAKYLIQMGSNPFKVNDNGSAIKICLDRYHSNTKDKNHIKILKYIFKKKFNRKIPKKYLVKNSNIDVLAKVYMLDTVIVN